MEYITKYRKNNELYSRIVQAGTYAYYNIGTKQQTNPRYDHVIIRHQTWISTYNIL